MKQTIACFLLALLLFQSKIFSDNSDIGLFNPFTEIVSSSEDLPEISGNNPSTEYLTENSSPHSYSSASKIDYHSTSYTGIPVSGIKKIDLPPPDVYYI